MVNYLSAAVPRCRYESVQVTSAAGFPAPAFPGLQPSPLWVPPAGHGPATVPVEGRRGSRPPFLFTPCARECAVVEARLSAGPGAPAGYCRGERCTSGALAAAGTSALTRHCSGAQGRTSAPSPRCDSRRKPSPARVSPQSLGFVLGVARAGAAPCRSHLLQPGC